jgi:hypothetical protein
LGLLLVVGRGAGKLFTPRIGSPVLDELHQPFVGKPIDIDGDRIGFAVSRHDDATANRSLVALLVGERQPWLSDPAPSLPFGFRKVI